LLSLNLLCRIIVAACLADGSRVCQKRFWKIWTKKSERIKSVNHFNEVSLFDRLSLLSNRNLSEDVHKKTNKDDLSTLSAKVAQEEFCRFWDENESFSLDIPDITVELHGFFDPCLRQLRMIVWWALNQWEDYLLGQSEGRSRLGGIGVRWIVILIFLHLSIVSNAGLKDIGDYLDLSFSWDAFKS
jgi:hypothetical protein